MGIQQTIFMKEFMKLKYPELTDFDNLQFVKDCEEEGIRKYKEKVKDVLTQELMHTNSALCLHLFERLELSGGDGNRD